MRFFAPLALSSVSSLALLVACAGAGENTPIDGGSGGSGGSGADVSATGGAVTASGGASSGTGGASSVTGGASSTTGGAVTALGGASSVTGGASSATGGASSVTGGASSTTGGTSSGGKSSTGGTSSGGTGGNSATTGGTAGTNATTGGSATGGSATGGSATGGSATGGSGGAVGGTVTWTATDYASRKWARWPIPNSASLNLPHPMSYTPGTDGVVDTVTGLVWQKSTNTATSDWQGALDYCKTLGAGFSLPTRIELSSILDTPRSGGKVDPVFTFGKAAGWTWASTPWVVNQRKNLTGDAALSWFINFSLGDSNNSLSQTATSAYSRCVKIEPTLTLPAEHYTVTSGEVKDNYTGLIWQQGHSGSTANLGFDQADTYCKGLALNGQTWRLPSLNEIASLVDDVPTGDVSPAIDHTAFPMTSPDLQYWSMSPYGTSTTERWTLNFKDGFTAHRATSTQCLARCVR